MIYLRKQIKYAKERGMNGGKWKVSTEENKIFNSF